MTANLACTRAALKIPRRFPIQMYRRHLLSIKSHTVLTCSLILFCSLDQILNILIQLFYDQLGVEMTFKIWWTFHLIFLLNMYVVTNVWIFWDTKQNFSELHQLPSWLVRSGSRVEQEPGAGAGAGAGAGERLFTRRAKTNRAWNGNETIEGPYIIDIED